MPKTINSPRHELLCGKVEEAIEILEQLNKFATNSKIEPKLVDLYELLVNIKHDGQRMEHKLALRKGQVRELRTALCGYKLAVHRAINAVPARIAPYTYQSLQEVDAHLRSKGDAFLQHDDGSWPTFDFD
ncbi:hypothetical protein Vid5_gp63 [Pantoea phage vB_PagS_Vid5]|uniref:Uncharacterized protein n=1 Tax=Pantoea phage vB_PagS_Vid5 TaxID=2099652 RepID=A0A2P1CKV8_9CAUD|nr:hypothetical protein FDJ45_gp092 [Pantoea phage vB_PagS_Vid5]AVJ51818.1 hypothetical protein Vid5_gp63 [Pantoea phage vB_PagS_Vid5]